MVEENIDKGKIFAQFVTGRMKRPFAHPEFIIYFLVLTVGIGAVDIWASLYLLNQAKSPDYQHLRVSIIGFSLILTCSGAVDLIFSTEKYIGRIIQLSAVSLIIIGIVVFFICFNSDSAWSYFAASVLALISLLVWWIANAENLNIIGEDFSDKMADDAKKLGNSLTDLENG